MYNEKKKEMNGRKKNENDIDIYLIIHDEHFIQLYKGNHSIYKIVQLIKQRQLKRTKISIDMLTYTDL